MQEEAPAYTRDLRRAFRLPVQLAKTKGNFIVLSLDIDKLIELRFRLADFISIA